MLPTGPLTAVWRASELLSRVGCVVLFACALGWPGIAGAWFFDAVLLTFSGIVVEHYKETGDVHKMAERFGLALVSFVLYFGITKTEAGLSSLHSQGLVVGGSKFFVLRLIETAVMGALFYAATWGWVDPQDDQNYYRVRDQRVAEAQIAEQLRYAEAGGVNLTEADGSWTGLTVVDERITPRYECEAQQAAVYPTILGLAGLYGVLPLAWCLDPARWRPSEEALAKQREGDEDGAAEQDELRSVAGTNKFIVARLMSQFGTVVVFGAAIPVSVVLGYSKLNELGIVIGSLLFLRLGIWPRAGGCIRRCCSIDMDPGTESAVFAVASRMVRWALCECCGCLRAGDTWPKHCCKRRRRSRRVAAYERSAAWAHKEGSRKPPKFPAWMTIRCTNM